MHTVGIGIKCSLPTGNASVCLSPPSKLRFAVLFCSICKRLISFSAIHCTVLSDFRPMTDDDLCHVTK